MPITTLITTVGTSLKGNCERSGGALKDAWQGADPAACAAHCATLSLEQVAALSAELRSTLSLLKSGDIKDPVRIILVASDTDDGRRAATLLQRLFATDVRFRFERAEIRVIPGLSDDYERFRREGLRNLVNELCACIRSYQGGVAINNTGGYKAEIAYAGIVGQAFGVPVYYQFEGFDNFIELPPLPVSVDLQLWYDHIELFLELRDRRELPLSRGEASRIHPKILQLGDLVRIDNTDYFSLSAAGELYIQACSYIQLRNSAAAVQLLPVDTTAPEGKIVTVCNDHHGNDLLSDFGRRLLRSPYLRRVTNSMPYNPHALDPVRRIERNGDAWFIDFVMIDTDAGYTLRAESTARNETEAKMIAAELSARIQQGDL